MSSASRTELASGASVEPILLRPLDLDTTWTFTTGTQIAYSRTPPAIRPWLANPRTHYYTINQTVADWPTPVERRMWKNKPPFRLILNKKAAEEIVWSEPLAFFGLAVIPGGARCCR